MRIPRSTIVMAVLTCIPFGFAVRDYLNGKDDLGYDPDELEDLEDEYGSHDDDYSEEDYARERAARLEEEAREEARKKERMADLTVALDKIVGKVPGSLGSAFSTILPGMTDTALSNAYDATSDLRTLARDNDLTIEYDDNEGILQRITIAPSDSADDEDAVCETLNDKLRDAWRRGSSAGSAEVWLNGSTQIRAEFINEYGCALTFRRYAPADKWIAKKDSIVPVAMIGQPHAKLVKSLEPQRVDLSDAEYGISWEAPGLGVGTGEASITAHIAKGKVVALVARTKVSSEAREELHQQLDKTFGAVKEDDYGNLSWGKKPPVTLADDYGEGSIELTIGTIPEE